MAYSPFAQPYIRAGIHHIAATVLFTVYAMRVSSFIDAIPFITLLFQTAALFLVLYLIRFSFYLIGSKLNALTDITLYTLTAIFYAAWHHTFYNFPLTSNMKVAFGIMLIGSLITIDSAITHARIQQDDPNSFVNTPKTFVPLAIQIGFTVVFFVFSLTMLLSLIMSQDLLWIAQREPFYLNIDNVNDMVRTFLMVAFIFTLYAICIVRNATVLVRKQLAYQVQALNRAGEKDFDNKVPMNTLGEMSIVAYYTNAMLRDLSDSWVEKAKNKTTESNSEELMPKPSSHTNRHVYRDDNENRENIVFSNLAALIAVREGASRAHLMRIQRYVKALAIQLATQTTYKHVLTFEKINLLYQCAPLYDIGKIAIPDNILKKPSKLTDSQLAIVKTHAQIGADILNLEGQESPFYEMAKELALTHHEWWDGSGYPNRLGTNDIPIVGRIMALADVYDALISKRSYRAAYDHNAAKEIIVDLSGKQFDPDVIKAFLEVENQFIDINRRYRDELLYTLVS